MSKEFTRFWRLNSARLILIIASVAMINQGALAQGQQVTGTVLDETGSGLPGASVLVKGTSRGTVTDIDGNFAISASSSDVLVFSFLGYLSQETTVGSNTSFQVNLELDAEQLEEIVVVGYGTQKRAEVTGAISSVDMDAVKSVPITTATQALQGRAAGVTAMNSAIPGDGATIRIRGLSTVNNNNPLVVVDGVVGSSLDNVNPNDIESIEVLKDASTTAIYGALGSNGVIMVTTKKGQAGAPKISLESWAGVQTQPKRYDLLNTEQYIQYARDWAALPGGVYTVPTRISDPQYASFLQNDTDWQDELYQNGGMQNVDVSVSGGSQNSNYRVSLGYLNQDAITRVTDYQRFNIRANTNFTAGKFTFGQTLNTIFTYNKPFPNAGGRSQLEHTIKMSPYFKVYNPNNPGGFQGPYTPVDNQDAENPIRAFELGDRQNYREAMIGTAYAEFEIIEGLKLKSQLGFDISNSSGRNFTPSYDDAFETGVNEGQSSGGVHFSNNGAAISRNQSRFQSILWTNSLNYVKTIADVHNINLLFVSEFNDIKNSNFNANSNNTVTDELDNLTPENLAAGSGESEYVRMSYIGRLNYNYDGKYIFSASMSRYASSRFGPESRWGNFPSLSLGWRISEETFMAGVPVISNLKLRGSWGITGNDNIGNYLYNAALANNFFYSTNLPGLTVQGTTAAGPVDPSIKWEETTMTNVGFDAGFLNDQISLSVEYYNNKSDDLLMNLPLTPSLRTLNGSVTKNVASVETSGFEISAGYNDYEGDFQWSINANVSTQKNEVLSLGGVQSITGGGFEGQNISRTIVGEQLFHFYGWIMEGVFQDATDVTNHATQNGTPQPGDIKYKDIAGPADEFGNLTGPDGVIDDNDRAIIGNPFPDLIYGINARANYKGFDFDIFLQGVSGNEVFNTNIYDLQGMTRLFNSGVEVMDRWTESNPSNSIPRLGGILQNTSVSSRYVEDGSYLRLRNISIGYTIPSSVINKAVSKIRVYASAQNLMTISGYSGLDPEIAGGNTGMGIDRGSYPTPKSFVGGIQVSF